MLLEQDGVTYNNPAKPHRPSGAWTLDPVPFIVPEQPSGRRIERGMIQRAELLDLVLRDLYGERRLLRAGVVPPEMILSDPQFVRACDGITLPGDKQLVVFGADLARSRRRPLGDARATHAGAVRCGVRPREPAGDVPGVRSPLPYDRRSAADAVHRGDAVGAARRGARRRRRPVDRDPVAGCHCRRPPSSTRRWRRNSAIHWFRGRTSSARNGRVGLRTVGGWVPVHVILRRVDAGFCDPLELRSDSTLGIPGLTDACRAGTVSVVNTLGSGVLENAGLGGLMSTLAKHLLGTDLVLESVPSWWCGDPAGRSHVLAHLGELVVRPLSRSTLEHSIDTSRASAADLDELRRRISARPDQWVGQERLVPGSAPVLTDTGIAPRATVLRTFAVAHGDSYVVMPGGLARAGSSDLAGPITNLAGAESKDMWVLGSDAAHAIEFRPEESDPAPHDARSTRCQPAPPSICSGSAGTPSAPRRRCG